MADQDPPGEDETPPEPAQSPHEPEASPHPASEPAELPPPSSGPVEPSGPFCAIEPARPRRKRSLAFRLIVWLLVLVLAAPPVWVLIYRVLPPPITPLMIIRLTEGQGLDYRWRPLSQISPALVQAAIAAEDSRFCQHNGFDFGAMQKAMAHNKRRPGKVRGGSTISQQTAKNAFLWPARSYVRKAVESYFTVLIEALWGKRRIMETYLNVVEMGPGIYGAEAAAQRYFGTDAAHLSSAEASRLAAIFPSPLKWRVIGAGRYVQGRTRKIGGAMTAVRNDGLLACVGHLSGAVPTGPLDLNAPPPKAAQAWVQQQQAAQAAEDAPPGPLGSDAPAPPSAALPTEPGAPAPTSSETPPPAVMAPVDGPTSQ